MSGLAVAAGVALILLGALCLALTMRAVTDPQAKADRDELRRRESLRTVLDGHTTERRR